MKAALWTGRVISALAIAFLVFDGVIKVLVIQPVLDSQAELGYPAWLSRPLGVVELICLALYVVPRTSTLGAVLLTGYLGGATASKVRLEDPWFLFSVAFGLLVWTGLYLRDERLRTLMPLRR